jgi:hypothetical protein
MNEMYMLLSEMVCDSRIPDKVRAEYAVRLHDVSAAQSDSESKLQQIVARSMGAGDQYEDVE